MSAKLYTRQKMIKGTNLSFDREITMGRGQQNKVVLDKKEVSKKHLRIFFDERQKCFILEDFGSANGTRLDDIYVEGKEQLRHLNVISIAGVYDFIFQDTQLCKSRHPNQKQKKPTLEQKPQTVVQEGASVPPPKQEKHSQTVVAGAPLSLPPDLKKTPKKSGQNLSETVAGQGGSILPPELGKSKKQSTPDHSKTIVSGGPLSLPPDLEKTPKKSGQNLSETVAGQGGFILPPVLGKPKKQTMPDHSKTIVSGGPLSLPPDLEKVAKKSEQNPSETVVGKSPSILPPGLGKVKEDEAKTVVPESRSQAVQFNKADQVSPQKPPPSKQRFFLEIWTDETHPRRFSLREGENIIGRKAPAHIIIEKIEISRRHAILTLKNESVHLKDAGSKNKTFVDGQEITEALEIQPSHELRFGLIKARVIAE